jgi:hypothetical protein
MFHHDDDTLGDLERPRTKCDSTLENTFAALNFAKLEFVHHPRGEPMVQAGWG